MPSIAKFCNLRIRDIFGTWDLGEIKNFNISGIWGPPLMKYIPLQGKINFVERRSKYLDERPTRKGKTTIINRGLKEALGTF